MICSLGVGGPDLLILRRTHRQTPDTKRIKSAIYYNALLLTGADPQQAKSRQPQRHLKVYRRPRTNAVQSSRHCAVSGAATKCLISWYLDICIMHYLTNASILSATVASMIKYLIWYPPDICLWNIIRIQITLPDTSRHSQCPCPPKTAQYWSKLLPKKPPSQQWQYTCASAPTHAKTTPQLDGASPFSARPEAAQKPSKPSCSLSPSNGLKTPTSRITVNVITCQSSTSNCPYYRPARKRHSMRKRMSTHVYSVTKAKTTMLHGTPVILT